MREQEEIMKVFFSGMINGWANPEAKKSLVSSIPGAKMISFKYGRSFKFVDVYITNPESRVSTGFTFIYRFSAKKLVPVWTMSYWGTYPKEIAQFVKKALMSAYQDKVFCGGRGPGTFIDNQKGLIYINDTSPGCTFENFSGMEKVISMVTGKILGFHRFRGQILT